MSVSGVAYRGGISGIKSAATSATNAAATITLGASGALKHNIQQIVFSYSAAPTGGKLTTTGLDGDQLDLDITASGIGPMMAPPAMGVAGGAVAVTLAAGGSGIVGKLAIFYTSTP